MQADDGNDASPPSTPIAESGSQRCVACGLDIKGLAASPLTFPGGLVCHVRSKQLVLGNVMSLLTGSRW